MFNLKELANNKHYYLEMFEKKGYFLEKEFNTFSNLYKEYSSNLIIEENYRKELNKLSTKNIQHPTLKINSHNSILKEEISFDKANNEIKNVEKEVKGSIKKATILSKKITEVSEKNKKYLLEIKELVSFFPNIPSKNTPIGKNEKDNIIIEEIKNKNFKKSEIFHLNILKEKNLILEKEASLLSGRRHVIYQNKAAQFIFALEQFMIDFILKKNYIMIDCPVIVNEKMLYNTAQLPKFRDDLFELKNQQFLIPTAEVPLTNLAANKIFKKDQLPLKYFAFTNCFRKEVASAGKDTKGIIRLHQFRKIEIVKIGLKDNLEEDFKEMVHLIKELLYQFEISYRLVNLCSGDLPFASKKTIDFEIWFPNQKKYREISSLSIIGNFQALRMNARVILENKKKEPVYTYNGSALAIDRLFAAIVENYYQKDGSIIVPKVLRKYLDFKKF